MDSSASGLQSYPSSTSAADSVPVAAPTLRAVHEARNWSSTHLHRRAGAAYDGRAPLQEVSALNNVLGGGMSSRLFQNIREKQARRMRFSDCYAYGRKHGTEYYKWRACLIPCRLIFEKGNHRIPVFGGFSAARMPKAFQLQAYEAVAIVFDFVFARRLQGRRRFPAPDCMPSLGPSYRYNGAGKCPPFASQLDESRQKESRQNELRQKGFQFDPAIHTRMVRVWSDEK